MELEGTNLYSRFSKFSVRVFLQTGEKDIVYVAVFAWLNKSGMKQWLYFCWMGKGENSLHTYEWNKIKSWPLIDSVFSNHV